MSDRSAEELRVARERHRLTTHVNACAARVLLLEGQANLNPIRTGRALGRLNVARAELARFEAQHPPRQPGSIHPPHRRDIDGPPSDPGETE